MNKSSACRIAAAGAHGTLLAKTGCDMLVNYTFFFFCLPTPREAMWYETPRKRDRVCSTLCTMLEDRGYQLVADDSRLTDEERVLLRDMPLVGQRADGTLTAVHYCNEPKMSVNLMRRLLGVTVACARVAHIIAVVHESVTPFAVREQLLDRRIQCFKYGELMFNVTHHVMVPQHRRVPPGEVDATLRRLRATRDQLPRMYSSDPVARYYGWEPGALVCCQRRMFGVEQDYYRLVTTPGASAVPADDAD
jgi:DNA-directed RNA polymerases I, II, and III subunit RPABC1